MQQPAKPSVSAFPLPTAPPSILEAIVAGLSDGVIAADGNGCLVFANPAARQLFRCDATGAPVADWPEVLGLYLPDRVTRVPADQFPLARALKGETVQSTELYVRNPGVPEGAWITCSAAPLLDEHGRLSGAVLTCRDITAAKRPKPTDWAAKIVETVGTLVVVLDCHGTIVGFNRACELTTGYTYEEIRGLHVWDNLLVPEEIEPVKHVFENLRAGQFPSQFENYWVAKDGSRRLIAWSNTAMTGPDGAVDFVIGTGMDITDRKRTEDQLRQVNETLRAVIETSPLAIVTMDLGGSVTGWNRTAEEMFGWRAAEVLGKPFPIIPEEDEEFFRDNLARLARGETIANVERRRRRRDGVELDVALWNAPYRDGKGTIIGGISVIADITDRKRLEEQFRQSQKMEAVGRLAGGVAHDFNNLLTVITGYTQMLLDDLETEHPLRGYVEEIVRASDSAAALTSQLLAFSRRQIVTPQVLDLNALVSGMNKLLHRLIGEDIDLVSAPGSDLPRIKVDPGQFQQVLMNLAVNARDAMPEGGTLTLATGTAFIEELDRGEVAPGNYVTLTVSDSGKGMDEETRRRVFEPFFTTKGRGKGTGLGLSTVYGIVKQAGGEVTVQSMPGAGTTFRIYLPAIERAAAAGVNSVPTVERKTGTETILVVEDEAGLRKLVREVLQNAGYTVLLASGFKEALSLADTYQATIHLVLTDMIMPGMSGRDLASRLTDERPRLKVLYMSGHTDHAVLEKASHDAGTHFLQKPFTHETLLAKIRDVLDK